MKTVYGHNRIPVYTKIMIYEVEGGEAHPPLILLGQLLDVTDLQRCILKARVHEPK